MILSKSSFLWTILCILSLLNRLAFISASPVKKDSYVPETKTFYLHLYKAKLSPDGFERVVWTVNGAIIVKDPDDPYQNDYDEDVVVLLSDWYHNETSTLLSYYLSPESEGTEPQPDNGLINGLNNYNCTWAPVSYKCVDNADLSKFNFVPGKRYLSNYWMRADLQIKCYYDSPIEIVHLNPYVNGIVHYEGANHLNPTTKGWADNLNRLNNCIDLNTSNLKPLFLENVPQKADQTIYLDVTFEEDASNINRGRFNGSSYVIDENNPTINQVMFKNQSTFKPNQNVYGQFNVSEVIDIVVYSEYQNFSN
ncbi:16729_t:CDS:2 [Racocetra fulgida]|uniref:16729_t:CDS:1 n=1 Tax=Racocetra fulgida TaxID=60492 RepID=A0A9N8ZPD6_9GLOM|nr:16729_t:CDS:2 [Racocetra fulgida]